MNSSPGNKLSRMLIPQDPQLMSAQMVVPGMQKKLPLRFERMKNQQLGPAVENRDQPTSSVRHGADAELVSAPIKRKSNRAMEFTRIVDFFRFLRKPKVSTGRPEEQTAVRPIPIDGNTLGPIGAKSVEPQFSWPGLDLIPQLVENLKGLNSTTEADFLSIGGNLQDFFHQAKELDQTGEMAAGLLSGEEISDSVHQLSTLALRISRMLEVSQRRQKDSLDTVGRVAVHLQKVARTVTSFENIAKSMHMMGITTRIESANLSQGSHIFQAFAKQIIQKSATIESKVNQINSELVTQGKLIAGNVKKLLKLSEMHQNQGHTAIKNLRLGIEGLRRKQSESSETANKISLISSEISKDVGEIVTSVQFHDITRQQLEHIVEALNHVALLDTPGQMGDFCRLQSLQLSHFQVRFVEAVQTILDKLKRISGDARSLTGELTSLMNSTGDDDMDFISELGRDMSSATFSLKDFQKVSEELGHAVDSVVEISAAMKTFLHEIDDIAYSIKTVALNAVVMATKIGKEGAPMEVVSQGIQRLSYEASAQAVEVGAALENIYKETDKLRNDSYSGSDDATEDVDAIAGELTNTMQSIKALHDRFDDLLLRMNRSSGELCQKIEGLVGTIDVHERVSNEIEKTLTGLGQVLSSIDPDGESQGEQPAMELLDELAGKYTMERQRDIHREWEKNLTREPETIVEPANKPESGKDQGEEELGSNVELF